MFGTSIMERRVTMLRLDQRQLLDFARRMYASANDLHKQGMHGLADTREQSAMEAIKQASGIDEQINLILGRH